MVKEWLEYMRYLKNNYPYLFSLSMRTNPFDRKASPIVRWITMCPSKFVNVNCLDKYLRIYALRPVSIFVVAVILIRAFIHHYLYECICETEG